MIFRFAQLDKENKDKGTFRLLIATHGIAMTLLLIAGFGLLARLELAGSWPHWVIAKTSIWLCLGAGLVFVKKFPRLLRMWWVIAGTLGTLAAYLAVFKPF